MTNLASFNATTCGYVSCPNLTGGTPSANNGDTACYLAGEEISGSGTVPTLDAAIAPCGTIADGRVVYAIYACGTYGGGNVDTADPNYLGRADDVSSLLSGADGLDPFGFGQTCLEFVPYYLCNDDVIYGGCVPTDAAGITPPSNVVVRKDPTPSRKEPR